MTERRVVLTGTPSAPTDELRQAFAAIRERLAVPTDFPAEVLAEAERVAAQPPTLPERDETDLPFITLDPPGSMDLDQAMHLERDSDGYRVRYAIADVPAFVRLGGALDAETRERGQSVYCPDLRVPLHPEVLSEGAGSLLPDAVRPAFVWDLHLDAAGVLGAAEVYRAMVRSVQRLAYDEVQEAIDAGSDDERFVLLREIGERRIERERVRGGASLPMPEQQIVERPDGGLHHRVPATRAGRGVERADLAPYRDGRRLDDARGRCGRAADDAAAGRWRGGPVPPGRAGARGALAPVDAVRRVHPLAGSHRPPPPGAHPRGQRTVPGRRVHRLRRRAARAT
jgi:hypothetical protein